MTDSERLLRRVGWLAGALFVLLIFVSVIVIALELQLQTRNTRLARLDVAVQETKTAADKATVAADGGKKALTDALKAAQTAGGGGPSGPEVKAALVKIDQIEQELQLLLDRR